MQIPQNKPQSCNHQQHSIYLSHVTCESHKLFIENEIPKIKLDEFTSAAKNDCLILAHGSKLYIKHGHEKHLQVQYLSQKIRE